MKPQDDNPPHDDDAAALRLRLHALEAHLREVEERTGETQSLRTPAAALRRHLQQATIRFEAVQ